MRRGFRIDYCEKQPKIHSDRPPRSECAIIKQKIKLKIGRISKLKQDLYVRNVTRDKYKIQDVCHEDIDGMDDLLAESDGEMSPDDIEINEDNAQSVHIEDSDEDGESNNTRNNYRGSTHAIVDVPFSLQYAFCIDVSSIYNNHMINYDCIDRFIIFQANNNRQYLFGGIRLRLAVVDKLKQWNNNRGTLHHDDKFVKVLLVDIFGVEILQSSTFSSLDSDKIRFIRGSLPINALNIISKISVVMTQEFHFLCRFLFESSLP